MSAIQKIENEKTRAFAEACYDQNSIKELQEAGDPDSADMKAWGITESQWREAISAALAERLEDAKNV